MLNEHLEFKEYYNLKLKHIDYKDYHQNINLNGRYRYNQAIDLKGLYRIVKILSRGVIYHKNPLLDDFSLNDLSKIDFIDQIEKAKKMILEWLGNSTNKNNLSVYNYLNSFKQYYKNVITLNNHISDSLKKSLTEKIVKIDLSLSTWDEKVLELNNSELKLSYMPKTLFAYQGNIDAWISSAIDEGPLEIKKVIILKKDYITLKKYLNNQIDNNLFIHVYFLLLYYVCNHTNFNFINISYHDFINWTTKSNFGKVVREYYKSKIILSNSDEGKDSRLQIKISSKLISLFTIINNAVDLINSEDYIVFEDFGLESYDRWQNLINEN